MFQILHVYLVSRSRWVVPSLVEIATGTVKSLDRMSRDFTNSYSSKPFFRTTCSSIPDRCRGGHWFPTNSWYTAAPNKAPRCGPITGIQNQLWLRKLKKYIHGSRNVQYWNFDLSFLVIFKPNFSLPDNSLPNISVPDLGSYQSTWKVRVPIPQSKWKVEDQDLSQDLLGIRSYSHSSAQ